MFFVQSNFTSMIRERAEWSNAMGSAPGWCAPWRTSSRRSHVSRFFFVSGRVEGWNPKRLRISHVFISRLVRKFSCKNPCFQEFLGEFHDNWQTGWQRMSSGCPCFEFWMTCNFSTVRSLLHLIRWFELALYNRTISLSQKLHSKETNWNPNNSFFPLMIVFVSMETCTSLVT